MTLELMLQTDLTGAQIDKNKVLISVVKMLEVQLQLDLEQKNQMVNINTTGYIELNLEYLQQVLQQKVIQLHSLHHLLKVQYYAEINQMLVENIHGKQKLLKVIQV